MATSTSLGPECLDDATVMDFLDGELSGEARAAVNAHVDGCSACLSLLAAMGRGAPLDPGDGPQRYEILGEVGSGGMGQVFSAFDDVLGREVALKCVRSGPEDAAAARRFEREMALTARLRHPAIIPVYDAGLFPDGSRYFAMRLVEGRTLDAALEAATSFEARLQLVPSIRRACEAVAYAHEQSVIHRDLKPANVLIGPFGETVVLDWGLAKQLDEGDERAQTLVDAPVGMTGAGAVMGTQGYIAAEVSRGEPADRRSDVFSLGKVLHRVAGDEDDRGSSKETLADLRAIVARATDPDPGRRYADARELCDDVRRFEAGQTVAARDYSIRSRVRRFVGRNRSRIVLSASFIGVGMLVGAPVALLGEAGRSAPCTGAEARLAGIWDDAKRGEVDAAFSAVGRPYARVAWVHTEQALDAYASRWVAAHVSACEGHARGEVSAELLDLRMGCLERASLRLETTTELLADADATVVQKAGELVRGLDPIEGCADADVLRAVVDPPRASEAESVEVAQALLARTDALRTAIRLDDARETLDAARAALDGVSYGPVRAELALAEGWLLSARGDYEVAEAVLSEAVRLAMSNRQREQARRALLRLTLVLRSQGQADEALRQMAVLEGLSQGDRVHEASFHSTLAYTLTGKGDYERAEAEHRIALAIREAMPERNASSIALSRRGLARTYQARGDMVGAEAEIRAALEISIEEKGEDHPGTATIRADLASLLDARGKYAEAEKESRLALESFEKALPSEHPDIVVARITLGNVLFVQEKFAEAEAEYRKAIASSSNAEARTNPRLPAAWNNLANLLFVQGRFGDAEREYRGALEMAVATIGPEHPTIALYRNSLGNALASLERFDEADAEYRAALQLQLETLPSGSADTSTTRVNLGNSLLGQSRFAEAESEFRQALRSVTRALGEAHPLVATVRSNLGRALLELDRAHEALPLLEQAWERRTQGSATAVERGTTAFLLARVLWALGAQHRKRARAMAQKAKDAFAEAGDRSEAEFREVEAWLN